MLHCHLQFLQEMDIAWLKWTPHAPFLLRLDISYELEYLHIYHQLADFSCLQLIFL